MFAERWFADCSRPPGAISPSSDGSANLTRTATEIGSRFSFIEGWRYCHLHSSSMEWPVNLIEKLRRYNN
jgi:hypothetical protein